ncbi:MAG TPA: RES domain-containing protein [Vicinamibacterales bacterium]
MSRRVSLRSPAALTGFPYSLPPRRLVRVCQRVNGTWWFSSDGSGRFDLKPPEGTCYFATDAFGAIREASRLGPVTPAWIAARELRHVTPPVPRARLAATTRKAAGAYGVTNELTTMLPYDLPREWAAAFRAHGFAGIRHILRHDPRARPGGVSWFGRAGDDPGHERTRRALTAAAVEAAGVRILDVPHSSVLRVVP